MGVTIAERYAEIYDWAKKWLPTFAKPIEELSAAEARINRLRNPTIYIGKHYSGVKLPERCPECDGRDFISHGMTGMICHTCWLTAELDMAEGQVAVLREALEAAGLVLRSYQYGNDATELAKKTADRIDAALARKEPLYRQTDEGYWIKIRETAPEEQP